jgi:hypothetical protein
MKLSCNCVVKDNWAVGRSQILIRIPRQNKQRWKVGKWTIPPLINLHNYPRIFPALFVVAKRNYGLRKQQEIHLDSLAMNLNLFQIWLATFRLSRTRNENKSSRKLYRRMYRLKIYPGSIWDRQTCFVFERKWQERRVFVPRRREKIRWFSEK